MEGAVEQLILGAHTSAYRTTFRICQTRDSRIDLKIVYRNHSTQILEQVATTPLEPAGSSSVTL